MATVYPETTISSTIGGDQIKLSVRGTKALVAFNDSGTLYVQAVSLGATTIDSFGTEVTVTSGNSGYTEFSFDIVLLSDTKGVVVYEDTVAGDVMGRVLTISGTTITAEAESTLVSGVDEPDLAFVTASRVLMVYDAGSNNVNGRVLDIGATTITVNSAVSIETGIRNQRVADIDSDRVIFACVDNSASVAEDIIYRVLYDITTTFSVGSPETSDTINDVVREYSIFLHYRNGKAIYTLVDGGPLFYIQAASVTGNSVSSGSKLQKTGVSGPSSTSIIAPMVIDATRAMLYYKENTESYVDDLNISGETLSLASNADNFVSGTNSWVVDFDFYENDKAVIVYSNQTSVVNMAIVESGINIDAAFYFGQNTLIEQFKMPFSQVSPRGMTLDKSLGTVVIGGKSGEFPTMIYSDYPYPTGTTASFPSGTAISAVRWI